MKHVFYIVLVVLISVQLKAQIANGGFETWETIDVYEQPVGFATGNRSQHALNVSGLVAAVPFATTKVTGMNGPFAARIETANQGIASTSGTVGSDDIFLSGFETFPYNGSPTSVNVVVRYSIATDDSSDYQFTFFKEGAIINELNFKTGGEQPNFTMVSHDIPAFSEAPDAVGVRIRNSDRINPASWLEIDMIEFGGTAVQLDNNTFDNWETVSYTDPTEWGSINYVTDPVLDASVLTQSSDAFEGSSSARILALPKSELNRGSIDEDFVPLLINFDYEIVGQAVDQGSPLGNNQQMSFAYKYEGAAGETALASYILLDNTGSLVDFGRINLDPASDWTEITMPFVNVAGATQVVASFVPGVLDDDTYNPDGGSILHIDDVNLSMLSGVNDVQPLTNFDAIYKSENREININFNEMMDKGQVSLYQVNGVKIAGYTFNQSIELAYTVPELPVGIYILDIIADGKRGVAKIFIN